MECRIIERKKKSTQSQCVSIADETWASVHATDGGLCATYHINQVIPEDHDYRMKYLDGVCVITDFGEVVHQRKHSKKMALMVFECWVGHAPMWDRILEEYR